MFRRFIIAMAVLSLGMPSAVLAQGVLVVSGPGREIRLPRPVPRGVPGSYKIKELDVRVRLVDRMAEVQVSQTFVNTGSRPMEVQFVFPLPYDGAIDSLTLMVDGKEHPARLLTAEEARRRYEEIVRKNRDPALLEWVGTGMFQTSVFPLPPKAERKVTLRYWQLCRRDSGLTDFLFPLSTAKYTSEALESLNVELAIEAKTPIKNVYSPTHDVKIERADDRHAHIRYSAKNFIPQNDFRLFYDVGEGQVGTTVLSYRGNDDEDGYLLLLASPQIGNTQADPAPKTVVFVVDRSGSMSGEKIEQAKSALKFVLNNLREGDLFNIIAYDSRVESFRPELERFDDSARGAALGFVDGLFAGGSTNIDEALRTALSQLSDADRPSYVIFLTDGLPTAGEQNEVKIVNRARDANGVRARVFAFGVGYDVNSRLLDKLVRANFGQSDYVRPGEDIEAHVSRLYRRIESPVLTDVTIEFAFDAPRAETDPAPVYRVYPGGSFDLFAGEQMVVVARCRRFGPLKVTLAGKLAGETQTLEFAGELVEKSSDESYAFVEKLWATRRIGEIIDQLDLSVKNEELVQELVELSTRHGILTPYTSFLADETTDLREMAANSAETERRLDRGLSVTSGRAGFAQRAAKGKLQQAAQAPAAGDVLFVNEEDRAVRVSTVRNLGPKSFFRRDRGWVDSTLTEDQESGAQRIEQFSDEYFRLASQFGRRISQYLAFDEAVTFAVDGQCYRIEPPSP